LLRGRVKSEMFLRTGLYIDCWGVVLGMVGWFPIDSRVQRAVKPSNIRIFEPRRKMRRNKYIIHRRKTARVSKTTETDGKYMGN
jgi:hypothetical protein